MTNTTALTRNVLLATVFGVLALSAATIVTGVRESGATSTQNEAENQRVTLQLEAARPDHRPAGAAIEHANAETFEDQVLRSRVPVLVDFYADWCGPCQIQDGILKEFAAEFDGGKIVKVNVDESPELAARYGVQGLPTVLIIQNGQEIARQVGLATKEQLRTALAG